MNKLCRICAKEGKKLSPLCSNVGRRKNLTVLADLNFVLMGRDSIDTTAKDGLPKNICQECVKKLPVAVNFIRECVEAQKKLREMCQSKRETKSRKSLPRKSTKKETEESVIPVPVPIPLPEDTLVKDELLIEDENPILEDHTRFSSDDDLDVKPPSEKEEEPVTSPKETGHDKTFQCSYCQRLFPNKFRLKNHIRVHTGERPFICKTCNRSFAQSNALKCHIRVHTGEKPYKCPVESCGKCFTQNTTLKTHMAALHIGKMVKCDSCEKTFTRTSYLTAHKRLEHLGERPHACHLCPKRYKQKSHLDHHLEVHQGTKYVCPVCNRSYSKKWSLQVHSFTHIREANKKMPYACTFCEESFSRRDKLKQHMKTKHQIGGKQVVAQTDGVPEEVPVPSNVVEVESRPIILQQAAFEGSQYQIINITGGAELIQEIVIPTGAIFY